MKYMKFIFWAQAIAHMFVQENIIWAFMVFNKMEL
jgi:hypothetical protein